MESQPLAPAIKIWTPLLTLLSTQSCSSRRQLSKTDKWELNSQTKSTSFWWHSHSRSFQLSVKNLSSFSTKPHFSSKWPRACGMAQWLHPCSMATLTFWTCAQLVSKSVSQLTSDMRVANLLSSGSSTEESLMTKMPKPRTAWTFCRANGETIWVMERLKL